MKEKGNAEVAEKLQNRINRYHKIDQMIDRSTVSNKEAQYATKHPQRYVSKLFAKDNVSTNNEVTIKPEISPVMVELGPADEGLKSGLVAAGITFTVSTVDNMSSYIDGKITAEEMVKDIAKDTGVAGALGYGTVFISTAVAQTLSHSSRPLIQSVGGSCLPAMVVSFAVDSYDSVSDYAQGVISGSELAYDLGESAASVAGGAAGGAMTGAALGVVAGPAGSIVGGLIGGVVGCAIATEAYRTAVEVGAEGAQALAEKAEGLANETIGLVEKHAPDKLNDVRAAFNDYAKNCNLPFSV